MFYLLSASVFYWGCNKTQNLSPNNTQNSSSVGREGQSLAEQFSHREDGTFYTELPEGYEPSAEFWGYSHIYLFVEDGENGRTHFIYEFDNEDILELNRVNCDKASYWVDKPWGKTEMCPGGDGNRCRVTVSGDYTSISWCD